MRVLSEKCSKLTAETLENVILSTNSFRQGLCISEAYLGPCQFFAKILNISGQCSHFISY